MYVARKMSEQRDRQVQFGSVTVRPGSSSAEEPPSPLRSLHSRLGRSRHVRRSSTVTRQRQQLPLAGRAPLPQASQARLPQQRVEMQDTPTDLPLPNISIPDRIAPRPEGTADLLLGAQVERLLVLRIRHPRVEVRVQRAQDVDDLRREGLLDERVELGRPDGHKDTHGGRRCG